MPPREIAHRVREKVYSELERFGVSSTALELPQVESFKDYLAAEPARRFYCRQPEALAEFVRQNFPQWVDRAVMEADQLCRHEVDLLGYGTVSLGPVIDWNRDPLTGRRWERRFWASYELPGNYEAGDPKTIHELSRHQHLPRLAKAYLFTADERYAAEAVAQMETWIEQNPPGLGVHWHSSLEIAIRAISWLWTIFLLLPSRSLDEASARRIGRSLFAQLEHVRRYTSIFSSPNTHLIGEATALFLAGLTFRDYKPAAAWLETGSALLAAEAEKQVLGDGVYGELSSYYHCYALDFYLQAYVLAERNAFRFPAKIERTVCAMLDFLMHLTRPDGSIPRLGDDDGGHALALSSRNYRSYREALCIGGVLFLREDLKHQAQGFAEDAVWFLGQDAWDIYGVLKSEPPASTQAFYRQAGYLIQRSGWDSQASHLVFDCGGLGICAGGHAHADALSFTLFSRGRELLSDPGTFVYNAAPEWRRYFRSTRAHNTVVIDGKNQAEPADTFRWKTGLNCRAGEPFDAPSLACLEAEQDAYERPEQAAVHRRRLLHVKPDYWVVADDFRGTGRHRFDIYYQFGPEVSISFLENDSGSSDARLVAHAGPAALLLGLYASGPLKVEIVRGENSPIAGWHSPAYGRKEPALSLRASLEVLCPAQVIAFVIPLSASAADGAESMIRRLPVEGERAVACAYQNDDVTDVAVISGGRGEVGADGSRMRGEFFWMRRDGAVVKQALGLHAVGLSRHGVSLLHRQSPGLCFIEEAAGMEGNDVRDLRDRELQRG